MLLKNLSAATATVVVPAAELQVFVIIGLRPAARDARGGVVRGGREVVGHQVVHLRNGWIYVREGGRREERVE